MCKFVCGILLCWFGELDDVVYVVVYFVFDESCFVMVVEFVIDGGMCVV